MGRAECAEDWQPRILLRFVVEDRGLWLRTQVKFIGFMTIVAQQRIDIED